MTKINFMFLKCLENSYESIRYVWYKHIDYALYKNSTLKENTLLIKYPRKDKNYDIMKKVIIWYI